MSETNCLTFVIRSFNFFLVRLWVKQSFSFVFRDNFSILGEHTHKCCTTSGLTEVLTPRKFRPCEDFPSNRSSELENPNRAGEIFRDGAKFGWRNLQGFGTVKFLLYPSERSGDRGLVQRSAKPKPEE